MTSVTKILKSTCTNNEYNEPVCIDNLAIFAEIFSIPTYFLPDQAAPTPHQPNCGIEKRGFRIGVVG
jgi:hypothetical protein